jgi:hypothetical protein
MTWKDLRLVKTYHTNKLSKKVTKKEEKRMQLNVVGAVTGIDFQKKQS